MAHNTQNPHRFLTPRSASAPLRPQHPSLQPPRRASQFTPAPRFALATQSSLSPASNGASSSAAHPYSPLTHRAFATPRSQPPAQRVDDIEDNSQEFTNPRPNIEHGSDEDDHDELAASPSTPHRSTKRRRRNPVEEGSGALIAGDTTICISSSPSAGSSSPSPPTTPIHVLPTRRTYLPILSPTSSATGPTPRRDQHQRQHQHQHQQQTSSHPHFLIPSHRNQHHNQTPDTHKPFPPNPKPTPTTPIIPTRPPFLLPPISPPSPPHPPSPSAFYTPHRRPQQKYLAGGLAAGLRDWVVETAERSRWDRSGGGGGGADAFGASREERQLRRRQQQRQNHQASAPGETQWPFRFTIAQLVCPSARDMPRATAGEMVVVREEDEDEEGGGEGDVAGSQGWILVGAGAAGATIGGSDQGSGSRNRARPTVDRCVGVREPVWDIELGRERWRVAIDWAVLGSDG